MTGDVTPSELPSGLLAEYLESMRGALSLLSGLADRLAAAGDDRDALDALRSEIHKIHGSAGSYGFMEASRLAAGMEATVKDWVTRPHDRDVDRGSLARWFVGRLAEMLGLEVPRASAAPRSVPALPTRVSRVGSPPRPPQPPPGTPAREPARSAPQRPPAATPLPPRPAVPNARPGGKPAAVPAAGPSPAAPRPRQPPIRPPTAPPPPRSAPARPATGDLPWVVPPVAPPEPAPHPSPPGALRGAPQPPPSPPLRPPPSPPPAPAPRHSPDPASAPPPGDALTVPEVIYVEDDPSLAELLQYGLQAHGYRFAAHRNGREALRELLALDVQGTHPLLLLDVDLPGLDGYSMFEALERERPGTYRVVFTTVHGTEEEQLRGLEAGALDYLVKPISLRVALEKIKRWVGR